MQSLKNSLKANFVDTLTDEVVKATVTHMSDRDVIVDINAKSEGVISLNEFRYNPALKVGDMVEVMVDVREDATGQFNFFHTEKLALLWLGIVLTLLTKLVKLLMDL